MKRFVKYLLLLGFIIPKAMAAMLNKDEYVMFIPDIAYEVGNNEIEVSVQAWIYEKERRRGTTTALTKYLGIDKNALTSEQKVQLYRRTQLFRVDSERNKNIQIQFNDKSIHQMPITRKDGRISTVVRLNKSHFSDLNDIHYYLYSSGIPAMADKGEVIFSSPKGIAIISDIDDTIKLSNVLNTKELLINTFLHDFKAVPNMSTLYQNIHKHAINTTFHYVSSSPIQLYPALKEFMEKENFPKGSMQLRNGTTWQSVIAINNDSKNHKMSAIQKLLNAYPQRQFILIGDSGEQDPEIYAEFMRLNPQQISCIVIRDVTNEGINSPRYITTFNQLDQSRLFIFKDPNTLKLAACLSEN